MPRSLPLLLVAAMLAGCVLLPATRAAAQESTYDFSSATDVYMEDFDTLVADEATPVENFVNASQSGFTLAAWYADQSTGTPQIAADDGQTLTGQTWSYGTNLDPDRALGGLGETGATGSALAWGVRFLNNTGGSITSVRVRFDLEVWYSGTQEDQVSIHLRPSDPDFDLGEASVPGEWTVAEGGEIITIPAGTGTAQDGNANVIAVDITFDLDRMATVGLNGVPDDTTFWIGVRDNTVGGGAGGNHGIGIDNFQIDITVPDFVVFEDDFDTGSGGLSSGQWTGEGVPAEEPQFDSGTARVDRAVGDGDVRVTLTDGPYGRSVDGKPDNDTIFIGFYMNLEVASSGVETTLFNFQSTDDLIVWGRIFVTPARELAVSFENVASEATHPTTLAVDTWYVVVMMLDISEATGPRARLWVDPSSAVDLLFAQSNTPPLDTAAEFDDLVLKQDATSPVCNVDFLTVARNFDAAVPTRLELDEIELDVGDGFVIPDQTVVVGQFTAEAFGGDATIDSITLAPSGSGTDDDTNQIANVEIWADTDGDMAFDAAEDTLLDEGTYDGNDTATTFDNIIGGTGFTVSSSEIEARHFFIVYDIGPSPVAGSTFEVDVTAVGFAEGLSKGLPVGSAEITTVIPTLQIETDNPANAPVLAGTQDVLMMKFNVTALHDAMVFQTIELDPGGTGNDVTGIVQVEIGRDANQNGKIDMGEEEDAGPFTVDDEPETFDISLPLAEDETATFIIFYDLSASPVIDQTFSLIASDIGVSTGAVVSSVPFGGRTITIGVPSIDVGIIFRRTSVNLNLSLALAGVIDLTSDGVNSSVSQFDFRTESFVHPDTVIISVYRDANANGTLQLGSDELVAPSKSINGDLEYPFSSPAVLEEDTTQRFFVVLQADTPGEVILKLTQIDASLATVSTGLPLNLGDITFVDANGGGSAVGRVLVGLAAVLLAVWVVLWRRPA